MENNEHLREGRRAFFRMIFRDKQGFVCIASAVNNPLSKKKFREEYFNWPSEEGRMLEAIDALLVGHNVWFCPQLLDDRKRSKEHIKSTPVAWADLDACAPSNLLVPASIVVESSPGRFQALWIFEEDTAADYAENLCKRIAYTHREQGADVSGWDLTQLLRVPFTYNYKYNTTPVVQILSTEGFQYDITDFEDYPEVEGSEIVDIDMPDGSVFPTDVDEVINPKRLSLPNAFWPLFQEQPDENESWSERLWRLEMMCFENGFTREQTYVIAQESACNKYKRDGVRNEMLWREVCRAEVKYAKDSNYIVPTSKKLKPMISDEERKEVEQSETFVERYIKWARSLGDAAAQYHQAGAFICLSSLLAGNVRLPTSFGTVVPNLWFMLLADTTLTRKTTAMDIAMDLLGEIDEDALLATDGSIEGLLTSMSTRPGRPSVFLRDEFSGLLEQMSKKDYMAGMAELLTKLYDGKMQKRLLRKETVEVREPCLIVFAGGIKTKITHILTHEQVSSGFMPRFIFITAESDITKMKPLGPPTTRDLSEREAIKDELVELVKHFRTTQVLTVKDTKAVFEQKRRFEAELTPKAWDRYNQLEQSMMESALSTDHPDIMAPTSDRLAKSILKASVLLAACRREEKVVVTEKDIIRAAYYGETWRGYVIEVMNAIGKSDSERQMELILSAVLKHDGISRSQLMQKYHLTSQETDKIFTTLEQRGQITRQRTGKGERLFAVTAPAVLASSLKGAK